MPGRGDVEASGFGERLKAIREERSLTQKQLGDSAAVHPNTIAKLERGEQEPAWPLVLKLAAVLGVDCTAFNATTAPPAEGPKPEKPAAPKKGGAAGVDAAALVQKRGAPELVKAVEEGRVTLDDAVKLLDISHQDQIKAVNAFKPAPPKKGKK